MFVDFRKNPPSLPPVSFNSQSVEVVHQYKYLGTIIDDKLTFEHQVDALCTKAHQRMYFYRKLRNFRVDSTFMRMFYSCFIESVFTFSFICWFGALSLKNKKHLQRIVHTCGKIAGGTFTDLQDIYRAQILKKARQISFDPSHPLWAEFKLLPSRRRYTVPKCRTNRHKNSFIPVAIGILNQSL